MASFIESIDDKQNAITFAKPIPVKVEIDEDLEMERLEDFEIPKRGLSDFNVPATLDEYNKICHINGISFLKHKPWMDLPLGSYEQMRSIFDWERDPVDMIAHGNRILEHRYGHREMASVVDSTDAVYHYCDESGGINAFLRDGGGFVEERMYKERLESRIEKLDYFMKESEGFTGTLFRGMKLPMAKFMQFRDSGSMLFKNFVSCSLAPIMFNYGVAECRNLNLALNHNPIVERLHPGINDGYVDKRWVKINFEIECDDISFICPGDYSQYPEECEIILERNIVLEVVEMFEYNSNTYDWPVCYVKARAIPLSKYSGQTLVL